MKSQLYFDIVHASISFMGQLGKTFSPLDFRGKELDDKIEKYIYRPYANLLRFIANHQLLGTVIGEHNVINTFAYTLIYDDGYWEIRSFSDELLSSTQVTYQIKEKLASWIKESKVVYNKESFTNICFSLHHRGFTTYILGVSYIDEYGRIVFFVTDCNCDDRIAFNYKHKLELVHDRQFCLNAYDLYQRYLVLFPKYSIKQLASELNVSVYHLQKRYKAYFKTTFGEFHKCQRLLGALNLLLFTTLSIDEIARITNFPTTYSFQKSFEKGGLVLESIVRLKALKCKQERKTVLKQYSQQCLMS